MKHHLLARIVFGLVLICAAPVYGFVIGLSSVVMLLRAGVELLTESA